MTSITGSVANDMGLGACLAIACWIFYSIVHRIVTGEWF